MFFFCVMNHYFFELVRTPECTKVTPFGIAYRIRSTVDTPLVPKGTLGGFITEDVRFESVGAWLFDDSMALANVKLCHNTILKDRAQVVGGILEDCMLSGNAKVSKCRLVNAELSDDATLLNTWCHKDIKLTGKFFGNEIEIREDAYGVDRICANIPCAPREVLYATIAHNFKKEGPKSINMTIFYNAAMVHLPDTGITLSIFEILERARSLKDGNHGLAILNMYRAIVAEWADVMLSNCSRITSLPVECRKALALAKQEEWICDLPRNSRLLSITIK